MGNLLSRTHKQNNNSSGSTPNSTNTYKTIDMVKIIEKLESDQTTNKEALEEFLDIVPISANYLAQFNWDQSAGKFVGKIIYIYDTWVPSITSIRDHIVINKLTDKCEIKLSPIQKRQLDQLMYCSIKKSNNT